ncbi:hypothetical protein DWG24_15065 [Dickeya zeae]|uniref:Uncharacterized protein n=1 Tax=Dickeya zeae TaxID=204042 RepID=A0AAE6Z237_9GAMM|nr:hypothetical protein DWG24_15065 [Dickeya zeae]
MLCSNQLSYVAIFSASPSSALRGALCGVGLLASTHFFPKNGVFELFVWVMNSLVRKASESRLLTAFHKKNGPRLARLKQ